MSETNKCKCKGNCAVEREAKSERDFDLRWNCPKYQQPSEVAEYLETVKKEMEKEVGIPPKYLHMSPGPSAQEVRWKKETT